jgi:outer membrane immunogenic protein
MKALLAIGALVAASSSAFAADMPLPPPVQVVSPPPIVHSWSGCYLGIEGGDSWGQSQHIKASPTPPGVGFPITNSFNVTGAVLGGTLGCNYQVANIVFGAEGDVSWSSALGNAPDQSPLNGISHTQLNSFDTLRGRVGYAWDRLFFYGTGGAAFANVGVDVCGQVNGICVSDSQIRTGWVAGGGIEWATWCWPDSSIATIKVEYLYADLGSGLFVNPPVTIGGETYTSRNVRLTNNIVRVGLNWKFVGW